jgi:hypothetical protein
MFPKKGKVFPGSIGRDRGQIGSSYSETIAVALREAVGDTHQAAKIVMRWTGADERTIKNWLAGTNGPSGVHLIALFRHSDAVLNACLRLAGRERVIADRNLSELREKLRELLILLEPRTQLPE